MKANIHGKDFDSWDEINRLLKLTLSDREITKLPFLPTTINSKDHPFWLQFSDSFGDSSYKNEDFFDDGGFETLGDISNYVICRLD